MNRWLPLMNGLAAGISLAVLKDAIAQDRAAWAAFWAAFLLVNLVMGVLNTLDRHRA